MSRRDPKFTYRPIQNLNRRRTDRHRNALEAPLMRPGRSLSSRMALLLILRVRLRDTIRRTSYSLRGLAWPPRPVRAVTTSNLLSHGQT